MADSPVPMPSKASKRRLGLRGTQILYGTVFVGAFALGMGFHFKQWSAHAPAGLTAYLLFGGLITVGFAALWRLLGLLRTLKDTSPARRIWTLLVSGGILTAVAGVTARIGRIEAPGLELGLGFDLSTGIALTFPTVVKMGVISVCMAGFAVLLLHRLRDLILVKRTRTSERNWNGLVMLMVAGSLLSLMQVTGAKQNEWQNVAMIIVAVFMVVNAFRLSWIVFLTFREKLTMLGLSLLLGVFLLLSMGAVSPDLDPMVPGGLEYLKHFFMPLAVFTQQAAIFGMIYCLTSFLSLLFHLPTSGDFEQRAGERATMHS
ncbi:MAG: hypothetical protein O3C45_11450, partial [Bacteroidetes bacterium]|nr:hypothetical protein [Bacteroidota bacterium]